MRTGWGGGGIGGEERNGSNYISCRPFNRHKLEAFTPMAHIILKPF